MTTTAHVSTEELLAHAGRCELVHGVIVEMAPASFDHGDRVAALTELLRAHVRPRQLGRVLSGDPGFRIDDDNVRAPDVAFVPAALLPQVPARGFPRFVPALAVEVVSPGDSWSEVKAKARMWLDHGVQLVWIVDPPSRTIEVHAPGQPVVELGMGDTLTGGRVLPEFGCGVGMVFDG